MNFSNIWTVSEDQPLWSTLCWSIIVSFSFYNIKVIVAFCLELGNNITCKECFKELLKMKFSFVLSLSSKNWGVVNHISVINIYTRGINIYTCLYSSSVHPWLLIFLDQTQTYNIVPRLLPLIISSKTMWIASL